MSTTDLEREREALGMGANGPDGRSIVDRAGDPLPDPYADPEEELFVLEHGRRVTIGQLIPRGTTVEYRVNLNAKSIKGGGDMGLLSFGDPDILLVVPARQGKVIPNPTYDEDGNLEKVTLVVNFKPLAAHDATSREGRALLGVEEA